VGGEAGGGSDEHAVSVPTMTAPPHRIPNSLMSMTLLLLEALGALVILVWIVWWTMFSGRPGGEPPPEEPLDKEGGEK